VVPTRSAKTATATPCALQRLARASMLVSRPLTLSGR